MARRHPGHHPGYSPKLGRFTWPAAGTASDGSVWRRLFVLGERGELLVFDDGRAVLPKSLRPKEEVELALRVTSEQARHLLA